MVEPPGGGITSSGSESPGPGEPRAEGTAGRYSASGSLGVTGRTVNPAVGETAPRAARPLEHLPHPGGPG